jgi:epoxide hydrolase-like predicted phosphatase
MIDSKIKNLIFDLGGVILDLSVPDTLSSFSQLSTIPVERVKEVFVREKGFEEYEKGMIDDQSFRKFIRGIYNISAGDNEIDRCWNAMLKGIPMRKLEMLNELKKKHRVFLLSNTNNIHLTYINDVILQKLTGENDLDKYFHKAYYSQQMLKRKPEPEIYQQVLEESNLKPDETLFLDDNRSNIESAAALGIQTILITSPDQVLEIFNG